MEKLKLTYNEREEFLAELTNELNACTRISTFSFDIKKFMKLKADNIIKPTINITASAYTKMFQLVHKSNVEISWHGLVKKDAETQTYTIYDILTFPQINSATATVTDDTEYGIWMSSLISDLEFPFEDMRMHGHSHVNMSVFSSGIDDAYQKDLLNKVEEGDYYIFLILNKKHDICPILFDMSQNIMFEDDDITVNILDENGNDILKWCNDEIKNNCITAKAVTKYNTKETNWFNTKEYEKWI